MSGSSGARNIEVAEEQVAAAARSCLIPLGIIFIFGILCLQGFNLMCLKIGSDLGAPQEAQLITAISGVALGIACFVYGSLGDFVSLRKMTLAGIVMLVVGSAGGFLLHSSIWEVVVFRAMQTAGCQVAGSVFIIIVTRYVPDREKVKYFGCFTASFNLATAIGVLIASTLSQIHWSYLFLIPLISVLFIPILYQRLSDNTAQGARVDLPGFFIFSCAIGLLTFYFSRLDHWWILLLSLLFFIIFVVYIAYAKAPFITFDWFKNKRWRLAILLLPLFYSIQFFPAPLVNEIAGKIYCVSVKDVSFYLLPAYLIATVVATCSGKIVQIIGHHRSMVIAIIFTAGGLVGAGICVTSGMVAIAIWLCVFFGGAGLFYSPAVDAVLSTVAPSEMGRGVGMNDLSLSVGSAIGFAILMSMLQAGFGAGFMGRAGQVGVFSTMFIVIALVELFCLVFYLAIRSRITRT